MCSWVGRVCQRGSLEAEAGPFVPGGVGLPSFTKNDAHSPPVGVCVRGTGVEAGANKSSPGLISK